MLRPSKMCMSLLLLSHLQWWTRLWYYSFNFLNCIQSVRYLLYNYEFNFSLSKWLLLNRNHKEISLNCSLLRFSNHQPPLIPSSLLENSFSKRIGQPPGVRQICRNTRLCAVRVVFLIASSNCARTEFAVRKWTLLWLANSKKVQLSAINYNHHLF